MSTTVAPINVEVTPVSSPTPMGDGVVTKTEKTPNGEVVNVVKPVAAPIVTPTPQANAINLTQPSIMVTTNMHPPGLAFPPLSRTAAPSIPVSQPVNQLTDNNTAPVPHPTSVPLSVACAPTLPKKSKKAKSKSQDKSGQGSQGENTGRWTAEEHRLFLQGLEEHGKGWKKIASLIKSRTVVQIRTHAQKYFQKLAKARQNGEEGDVSMEGRGVNINIPATAPTVSSSIAANNSSLTKRRRQQVSGTKRKALSDVVTSVHRDAKKEGKPPIVSPVLAPFLISNENSQVPDVSPAALEDSLYRFLTPATTNFITPVPSDSEQSTANEIVQNVSAGPTITLPPKDIVSGEGSPTGVIDLHFPLLEVKEPEPPQWFARGADVDELLNEAEALDWLADPGDIISSGYTPPIITSDNINEQMKLTTSPLPMPQPVVQTPLSSNIAPNLSTVPLIAEELKVNDPIVSETTPPSIVPEEPLPPVVSYSSISMNELPALFDSPDQLSNKRQKLTENNLFSSPNDPHNSLNNDNLDKDTSPVDETFNIYDTNFDEQAFVTALLDSSDNTQLSVLSEA